MADAHKNFAYSTVATAPSPASSGTSLTVQAGDGGLFPTPPFNCTVWPANGQPRAGNAEIVRVTAIATDTFTITRTQESSVARSIQVGDQIAATITAKTLTDAENGGSQPPIGFARQRIALDAAPVTVFAPGHGFATSVSGSSSDDSANFCLGSQSLKIVTAGSNGTQCRTQKTGLTAQNMTGRQFVLWLYIQGSQNLPVMTFYAGDTALANFNYWNIQPSSLLGNDDGYIQDGTWVRIVLNWQNATASGTPTRTAVTDYRLMVQDNGTPVTIWWNGIGTCAEPTSAWPNGVCSVTFDDGFASVYTTAKPIMDALGFPGTAYIIQDIVGTSGRMTLAQLQQMQNVAGWDIQGHAHTLADHNAGLDTLSPAALLSDVSLLKQWLIQNGLGREPSQLAYPNGQYDQAMIETVSNYFSAGRTFYERTKETFPPGDHYRLRCRSVSESDSTGTITPFIDAAYANHGWLILLFHDIVATPTLSTQYSTANFTTIMNYLQTKGIPVRTVRDVLAT